MITRDYIVVNRAPVNTHTNYTVYKALCNRACIMQLCSIRATARQPRYAALWLNTHTHTRVCVCVGGRWMHILIFLVAIPARIIVQTFKHTQPRHTARQTPTSQSSRVFYCLHSQDYTERCVLTAEFMALYLRQTGRVMPYRCDAPPTMSVENVCTKRINVDSHVMFCCCMSDNMSKNYYIRTHATIKKNSIEWIVNMFTKPLPIR